MENLVRKLKKDHPSFVFSPGHSHCWSPEHGQISYAHIEETYSIEGLLHELGHARLGHQGYTSDLELLRKEVQAWDEAKQLAGKYGLAIDEEHVQDCLDTYRDWVYKRSICPRCTSTGLQQDEQTYGCLNCGHVWQVTTSRFCRPYRRSKTARK
jgi:hypothetical protein